MSLEDVVVNSRLAGLRALLVLLAREIEQGPLSDRVGSSTAALARQLRDVMEDIEKLEKSVREDSLVDDLSRRRAARKPTPAGDVAASGGGKK